MSSNSTTGPSASNAQRSDQAHAMPAPLSGIRVLDMSRVLAGPWAAQLLADFGAEVIKIERPGVGDDTRNYQPSFESTLHPGTTMTSYFVSANRGKQSITIDFRNPEGAQLVRELAAKADVLIENYVVGTLARAGLDYAALSKINPRLIYCSITGYGQYGPSAGRPGYDNIAQAVGGLMSVTGEPDVLPDGRPGSGPLRVGTPITDIITGVHSALAVTAALRQRDMTGLGQYIDMALLDVAVFSLALFATGYLATGNVPQRIGNRSPQVAPAGAFRSADGWFTLMVGNDSQFAKFCQAIATTELLEDPRFATNLLRGQNVVALEALISPTLASMPADHWVSELEKAGVPCGRINDIADVFKDPQVVARGDLQKVYHPVMGELPVLANPMRMSNAPVSYDIPPPMLGEHTESILRQLLGKSPEEIAAFKHQKIV